MTPAQRIMIVIGGCLVLVVFALFIIYPAFQKAPDTTSDTTPTITDPSSLNPLPVTDTSTTSNTTVITETKTELSDSAQRAEAERLSRLFIERFGSYSNFSNFENITSLEAFMTPAMLSYVETLKKQPAEQSVGSYNGVTTTVISLTTTSFTAKSKATVSFVVQQESQNGLDAPITSEFRDGRIELKYADGQWLVDGVFYNNK